jgi:hypothetical protein
MNSVKDTSAGQAHTKTRPEEFDLVTLGGTGSTIAVWNFAEQGQRVGRMAHR